MRGLENIVADNREAQRRHDEEVAKRQRGETHDSKLIELLAPSQTAVKSVA